MGILLRHMPRALSTAGCFVEVLVLAGVVGFDFYITRTQQFLVSAVNGFSSAVDGHPSGVDPHSPTGQPNRVPFSQ